MATILVVGKEHIRGAKTPQFSRHRLIEGTNQYTWPIRIVFNRYTRLSRAGIAPTANVTERYDVIHCLNYIPVTHKPWIITFEDILPRTFGHNGRMVARLVRPLMLAPNCRKVVGQSRYALKKIAKANEGWSGVQRLLEKAMVIYPSLTLETRQPKVYSGGPIQLVFCGGHFARKGGVSAVRLAKLAYEQGFPLTMHIVSSLRFNAYTDFMDTRRYEPDLALLDLPNVVFHNRLDNRKVLELFERCDFQYLPTIGDTFGFSVVEGFSVGTPAIVSNTCAMPELVRDGENGYLLDVEVNDEHDISWLRPASDVAYRETEAFWEQLDRTYSDFARETFRILEELTQRPADYEALSAGALAHVARHHDARKMSEAYDQLYDEALI